MVLQDTNIILYLSKGGNNLFKAAEEIRKNKQYIERLTTDNDILFIEYTKGNPSLFRIDIEIDRPEYERDGNGFVLDIEICAYYCIDFINCLKSWVNRPDRADIMDRQIKPCEPILNKGFEDVNLIRQYSTNNPFSLLYCSILECYKVIQRYYPEFIPNNKINNNFCLLNGKSATPEINQKEQTTPTKNFVSFTREFSPIEQKKLFDGLIEGNFIPENTNYSHFCAVFGNTPISEKEKPFTPLVWTATNKKAGNRANKKSLLDLLKILKIPETEIKNRTLINSLFTFQDAKPLSPQNYTPITDTTPEKCLKKIQSEYHTELLNIVNNSKNNSQP